MRNDLIIEIQREKKENERKREEMESRLVQKLFDDPENKKWYSNFEASVST